MRHVFVFPQRLLEGVYMLLNGTLEVSCLVGVNHVFLGQFIEHFGYFWQHFGCGALIGGIPYDLERVAHGFGVVAILQAAGFRLSNPL